MNKVIKVTEDEIFVGKSDGSVVKTEKSNASWDVQVGDYVEIFSSGDMLILNLISQVTIKKKKDNSTNSFSQKLFKLCRRVLPVTFTALLVFFLTALIVIVSVPRGWKYKFEESVAGAYANISIRLENDEYAVLVSEIGDYDIPPETFMERLRYRIIDGRFYMWSEEDESFMYCGKISSTKIEWVAEGVTVELKENTMITLKVFSIVFMSVFAALDVASIVVCGLIKNGKIKIKEDEKNIEIESAKESVETAE